MVDLPLLKEIWTNRNANTKKNPIFVQPVERAGKSVTDKLISIRNKMEELDASVHVISSLDDVAWTLNLRGSDVQSNPVFLGYIICLLYTSNRVVRRIFGRLGYEVELLDRVMFAGLTKKNIKRGHWRILSELEVNNLKMM